MPNQRVSVLKNRSSSYIRKRKNESIFVFIRMLIINQLRIDLGDNDLAVFEVDCLGLQAYYLINAIQVMVFYLYIGFFFALLIKYFYPAVPGHCRADHG